MDSNSRLCNYIDKYNNFNLVNMAKEKAFDSFVSFNYLWINYPVWEKNKWGVKCRRITKDRAKQIISDLQDNLKRLEK